MFYIMHAHRILSVDSANSINCVDGAATHLAPDLSNQQVITRMPVTCSVVDRAVPPTKPSVSFI